MTEVYRPTCPRDEAALYPIVLDPDSAPWFCAVCRHSYWVAQLTEEGRKNYRVPSWDFGFGPTAQELAQRVEMERQEAHARGSSCRPDQLALLPVHALGWLQDAQAVLDSDFHAQVKVELARKGG